MFYYMYLENSSTAASASNSFKCFNLGRSEGTSSVAFEVLLTKSEIDFINLFVFNCLKSNINLFNFNCFMSIICFPKKIFFASRRERIFMDVRPQFWVFNSTGKMMTCYLRDTNKILRYRTLCTNILRCKFPTKRTELTRLEFFELTRLEFFSYCGQQQKYSATTKLHCNLQKESRGSDSC